MAFSFRRLVIGVLLSNIAGGVLFVVLPLMVLRRDSGPLLATLIIVAPLLAQTLASFGWGALSDHLGRRREIMVAGAIGAAVLYLFFPLASPTVLLLLRTLQAALLATSTLVYALTSEGTTGTVGSRLGNMMMWGNVGQLIGVLAVFPLLTLTTLDSTLGWELVGVLSGATALSAFFLATAGDLPRARAEVSLGTVLQFRRQRPVAFLSLATFPLAVGNYAAYTTLPVYLNDGLGKGGFFGMPLSPVQQLGLFTIATTIIAIPYCLWAGDLVEGVFARRLALVLTPLLYAGFWLAYTLSTSYLVFFVVWAIPLYPLLSIAATRELSDLTAPGERGRGIGLWTAVYTLGGLVGGVLAGLALEAGESYQLVFLQATVLAASGALTYGLVIARTLRFRFRDPADRADAHPPT